MIIQMGTEASVWTTKTKALAAALMLTAVMAMSLLVPVPAEASAFPGANGKIVFSSNRTTAAGVNNPEGDEEIFVINPDGTGLKQLTRNAAGDSQPAISSDGKKVAFVSGRTGNLEVFVMNSDGTGQKNLTSDLQNDTNPTYSAQGDKIAFVSNRDGGDQDVFVMKPDGTQQTPLTSNDLVSDSAPNFSPNGSKIAFTSNRDGAGDPNDFDVFAMNADGSGTPTRFTNSRARDTEPAFSPDGTKVAFTSERDGGDPDIFVMDATTNETGLTHLSTFADLDNAPVWQPSSTFTVTSAADTGDGVCDSVCTLREAINVSNAPKAQPRSTIKFDIPGGGVQTVTPAPFPSLPPITRPVTVDGYSQPGASPNTLAKGTNAAPKVEISGAEDPGGEGLVIQGFSSSGSVIRGLVIDRFSQGIRLEGGTADNRIEGNFIGADPTGTLDQGNSSGVVVDGSSGNAIGGAIPAARNVVSGNENGILMGDNAQGNGVLGNLIGTTAGGNAPLGNDVVGVALLQGPATNNEIGDGTPAGSNTVAFNGSGGGIVVVDGGQTRNPISRNSIFSNVGPGIDLGLDGPTANDADDADSGANNLQNKPVLSSAKTVSGKTTISGKLTSNPNRTFRIQFYSNPAGTDEGKTFVGQKSVSTDGSGNATFSFSPKSKVALGQNMTATATDPSGNTSEFSAPRKVASS